MKNTISVIIPVYNVRNYLPQCVESVRSQSYEDLEILLIDDGSTDGSGALCDAYGAEDPRIRVIHRENGGAAAAKNTGLRAATGSFVSFVDSDDYLEPGAYAHMAGLLEETGADAVQCSFRDIFADRQEDVVMLPQRQEFSTTQYLHRYTTDWTCGMLPDKLFRRSLTEGLFLTEGHVIDDEYFSYQVMMNAARVVHDPRVVYNYRQRISGAMRSPASGERLVLDKLDYLTVRREEICGRFPELKASFDLHFLEFLLILSRDPYATAESLRLEKKLLRRYRGSRPDRGTQIGLWKLRLLPVRTLLKKRHAPPAPENSHYFP